MNAGKKWIGKVRMVENVNEIGAQLHAQTLGDRRSLVDRQVPLFVGWTVQGIAPLVAKWRVPGTQSAAVPVRRRLCRR